MLNVGAVKIQRAERRGTAEADVAHDALPVSEGHYRRAVPCRGKFTLKQHAHGDGAALKAERLQQRAEQPVQLKAEAAAPPPDDLVKNIADLKRHLAPKLVDVQILKRHAHQMRADKHIQRVLAVPRAERGRGIGKLRVQRLPVIVRLKADARKIRAGVGDGAEYSFVHFPSSLYKKLFCRVKLVDPLAEILRRLGDGNVLPHLRLLAPREYLAQTLRRHH